MKNLPDRYAQPTNMQCMDTENGIGTERLIEHHPVVVLWTTTLATPPG
jgi:hypothetical protein